MAKPEGKAEEGLNHNNFFIENLLRSTDFDSEKIASLAGVSVLFVEEVRKNFSL